MMVDAVCKRYQAGLGETPAEASCHYCIEAFVKEHFEFSFCFFFVWVADTWPNVVVFEEAEGVEE